MCKYTYIKIITRLNTIICICIYILKKIINQVSLMFDRIGEIRQNTDNIKIQISNQSMIS